MNLTKAAILLTAAIGVLALAGNAAATTVTGPSGETTPTLHAVNSGGHVKIANPIANIECSSTWEGKIERHGTGVTASGNGTLLNFSGCTNSWHVTVHTFGSIEYHYLFAGTFTLTSNGATITVTRLGVTCTYATNATDVGIVTDSTVTGGPWILHINSTLPIHTGSSALCGTGSAKWEGSYVGTTNITADP